MVLGVASAKHHKRGMRTPLFDLFCESMPCVGHSVCGRKRTNKRDCSFHFFDAFGSDTRWLDGLLALLVAKLLDGALE